MLLQSLLNLIYPKRCLGCSLVGRYLCDQCLTRVQFVALQLCPACKFVSKRGLTHLKCRSKTRLDGIQSLAVYDGAVRSLIQKIKYKGAFAIVEEIMPVFLSRVALEFEPSLTIIPIPLHRERVQKRGFNQSALITQNFANYFSEQYVTNFLIRKRNTITQTHLTREERLLNLKNAFQASPKVKGQNFLLVDDVWTTGATLNEAARELKRKGAKYVFGFTIAVGK